MPAKMPEVVEDGVSGYLVPPGRPDLLAEAIVKMLNGPKGMQAMGRAGYERVKKDFTFEAQTEKLEKIYRKVIGNKLEDRKLGGYKSYLTRLKGFSGTNQ